MPQCPLAGASAEKYLRVATLLNASIPLNSKPGYCTSMYENFTSIGFNNDYEYIRNEYVYAERRAIRGSSIGQCGGRDCSARVQRALLRARVH